MRKGGRPRKEIDRRTFEGLCRIQCTLNEMCAALECDNKTLENWCKHEYGMRFSEIFSKKRVMGYVSLRRKIYKKAVEDEDCKMQIFLAKNWLGMSDKQDVKLENPIEINSSYDWTKLTEQEVLQLRELLMKATNNGTIATNIGRNRRSSRKTKETEV